MKKRGLTIGSYNTAFYGWTLAALTLTDPVQQTYFLDVVGRDGPLDLSTGMTDGVPRYGGRTLTATLENSEGTRASRRACIANMVNTLDGYRLDVQHPDYPGHYLTGRVKIEENYNDLAHAAVTVTVTCDTWLYCKAERAYTLTATEAQQVQTLENRGRRVVVPTVVITAPEDGTEASVLLETDAWAEALGVGTFLLPGLPLHHGKTEITYSGSGTAKITFREAVLR